MVVKSRFAAPGRFFRVGMSISVVFEARSEGACALAEEEKPSAAREFIRVPLSLAETAGEDVIINIADTGEEIEEARRLINDRYAWRGYGDSHQVRSGPSRVMFTAEFCGQTVGTITLVADSAEGLAADCAFRAELDDFRHAGRKICELAKFAFDPEVRSLNVMAALFHVVFVYGDRTHGCTDLCIEVNPRHVRFYEKMLGFECVGSPRLNTSVAAPAQLMWLSVSKIREQINLAANKIDRREGRSLYRLFFSPSEEHALFERLAAGRRRAVARTGTSSSISTPRAWPAAARLPSAHGHLAKGLRSRRGSVSDLCRPYGQFQ